MAKPVYDYTLRLDKAGNTTIANETGALDKPENSISYMLVGLISCIAITVKPILEKMRIECDAVVVHGLLYMVDDTPRYSDRIECSMSLENGPEMTDEIRDRVAELTKKYCSVSVTIAKNPKITLAMK
jgi:uncharacterized OsmC-like protein